MARMDADEHHRFADWPLALKSILGFWLVYAATVVIRAFLHPDPGTVLFNRTVTLGIGVVLTLGLYVLFAFIARKAGLKRRILIGFGASFLAAAVQSGLLIYADRYLEKPQNEMRFTSREGHTVVETGNTIRIVHSDEEPLILTWPHISELEPWHRVRIAADSAVTWFFFFAAWSAFYMAMLSQAQALGAQRRAAEAEAAARSAQVRALRYQVNPHFLFNTLNSLSSLIMTGRGEKAEDMLLKLSTFFRSSLSLDPSADVTLAEEIDLQRLYLDIEKVRFPSRLKVEIDIAEEVREAKLPALILQPLVENAIKYGVSPTKEKVILRIAARPLGDGRFEIIVTNSGTPGAPRSRDRLPSEGTGVGLNNVCQRLSARFGAQAKCEFGPLAKGGYQVHLTLPLDRSNG